MLIYTALSITSNPDNRTGPPNNGIYFRHLPRRNNDTRPLTQQPPPASDGLVGEKNNNEHNSDNSLFPRVRTENQKEITHVAFLKVHKTASSTAQNIFLRFGDARNLTFVLAHTKGESGWLNVISYRNSLTINNVVPPPSGKHFDILCCHVIYNQHSFATFLPSNTVNIGIVREPISRFQSAVKYFSPGFIMKIPGDEPLRAYARNPLRYEPDNPTASFTNNRMAVEFGFPLDVFPGKNNLQQQDLQIKIQNYINILDNEFDFIIISERFEESMVLMKRMLNWSIKDILYIDKNVASSGTNNRKVVPKDSYDDIRKFLYLDTALYEFALRRFNKLMSLAGKRFYEECNHFKTVRKDVHEFCAGKTNEESMNVAAKPWSEGFRVTRADCRLYAMHEKTLIQKQRMRMYGTFDN